MVDLEKDGTIVAKVDRLKDTEILTGIGEKRVILGTIRKEKWSLHEKRLSDNELT